MGISSTPTQTGPRARPMAALFSHQVTMFWRLKPSTLGVATLPACSLAQAMQLQGRSYSTQTALQAQTLSAWQAKHHFRQVLLLLRATVDTPPWEPGHRARKASTLPKG